MFGVYYFLIEVNHFDGEQPLISLAYPDTMDFFF